MKWPEEISYSEQAKIARKDGKKQNLLKMVPK